MLKTLEKKILVVDEDQTNRKKVANVLNRLEYVPENGYKIEEEDNSYLALEKVKTEKYSLIIMAWAMKKMNGIQTIEKIRKFNKKTPIIIMAPGKNHLKVSEIGANAYFNQKEFRRELPRALQEICPTNKQKSYN